MTTAKAGKRARCSPRTTATASASPRSACAGRTAAAVHPYLPRTAGWGTAGNRSLPSYRAESLDGGLTWSQPKPCGILNNESKLDVISWDKETILMAYNDTPETDWHERSPLTLAYSKDEGLTWQNLITLAPAPGNKCQPAMCRDAQGRLNVIYMHRHTAIEHLVLEITD